MLEVSVVDYCETTSEVYGVQQDHVLDLDLRSDVVHSENY